MKVIIFGATGGIGKHAIKHALKEGYDVIAYVRTSSKLQVSNSKLTVIEGSLDDYEKMKAAMLGCEAVVWCVGIPLKKSYSQMRALNGHKVLMKAMKELGIRRLIDWGTPSIPCDGDKKGFVTVIPGVLAGIALTKAKEEMIAIGDLLKQSDTDWTMVRFMMPTNGKYKAKAKVGFGEFMNLAISREDIAAFMVAQIESSEYLHKMPIIGS